jgi:hypothetical protein
LSWSAVITFSFRQEIHEFAPTLITAHQWDSLSITCAKASACVTRVFNEVYSNMRPENRRRKNPAGSRRSARMEWSYSHVSRKLYNVYSRVQFLTAIRHSSIKCER